MNSERWQQLKEVLEAALARTPGHPAAFLDEACAGDESRRRQPGKCASIKSPISVPVSPSSAVKCYPCREVSLNYSDSISEIMSQLKRPVRLPGKPASPVNLAAPRPAGGMRVKMIYREAIEARDASIVVCLGQNSREDEN